MIRIQSVHQKMEKPKTEVIKALGKPFSLGYLYDIRRHNIIDRSLWDHQELDDKMIKIEDSPFTDYKVAVSNTVEEQANIMDIGAGLKMSFLAGMVDVSGSARYLDKRNSSSQVASVTLKHEMTTETKRLSMQQMAGENITYPELLDDEEATHVVSSITYGANAFFKFETKIESTDIKTDVSGDLSMKIKKIPKFDIDGHGDAKIDNKDEKNSENIDCHFVGDYHASRIGPAPTDFDSAMRTFQKLGKDLTSTREGFIPVPINVTLTPLHTWDPSKMQLIREVSGSTVANCSKLVAYFDEVQAKLNNLKGHKTAECFSDFKDFVVNVANQFTQKSYQIKQKIAAILPQIRDGKNADTNEGDLKKLIADFNKSIFSELYFNHWYKTQLDEVEYLDDFLDAISEKGLQISQTDGSLKKYMNDKEGLLVALTAHIVSNQSFKLLEDLQDDSKDLPASYKYPINDNATLYTGKSWAKLLKIMRTFVKTYDIEDNKENYLFIADLRYGQKINANSIKFYKDGDLLDEELDLDVEIGNVRYKDGSLEADFLSGTSHKTEVRYKSIDSSWRTSDALPKLVGGVYQAQMRFVLQNGIVGGWTNPIHFEVKGKLMETLSPEEIGEIATSISAGETFASVCSSFRGITHNVAFLMKTENFTDQLLTFHEEKIQTGRMINSPMNVKPGTKEAMSGRKVANTATGCIGTMSWIIGDSAKMLVVMYSIPFDQNMYTNWCGVGIFDKCETSDHYSLMYYETENKFSRKDFYYNMEPVVYKDDSEYNVEATMDASHKPQIKVHLLPKSTDHLSTRLKKMTISHN